ncbi:hypothetical protein NC651_037792 [Populus alba x Populus x berolinensis]|nr:hypothetical protein NC651_037792 [Populus alba x Populus x berolinensis]
MRTSAPSGKSCRWTLIIAEVYLSGLAKDTPFQDFLRYSFKEWGFEKGWGDTAERSEGDNEIVLSESTPSTGSNEHGEYFLAGYQQYLMFVHFLSSCAYFWSKQMSSVCQIQAVHGMNFNSLIADQVKALEEDLLLRIKQQGLNVKLSNCCGMFTSPQGVTKFQSWLQEPRENFIPDGSGNKVQPGIRRSIDGTPSFQNNPPRVPF